MASFEIKGIGKSKVKSRGLRRRQQRKSLRYTVVSSLLILVVGCGFFFYSSSSFESQQKFVNSMRSKDYTGALMQLESIDGIFKRKYSKFNARNSSQLPSAQDRKDFVRLMIEALDDFDSGKHYEGLKALKSMQKDITKVTAGVNANRSRFNELYVKSLRSLIGKYKNLRRQEALTPKLVANNENRIYQQSILSKDLAEEFGLLMGLASNQPKRVGDGIDFYRKGILKGLPVLKRLPDDIKDLRELKQQLKIAGGEVRIRGGSNTPDIFLDKITDLRAKCSVFEGQITGLIDENKQLWKDLEKSKLSFEKELAKINRTFSSFVINYVSDEKNLIAS